MADVFISYPKTRRALTERVARDLEAAGLSVWWDTRIRLGEGFRNQIDDELDACKAALVIWTPESIKSDWVIAEADHAWQQKKLVNTHLPDIKPHQIPKPFNQLQSLEIASLPIIIEAIKQRIAKSERHAGADVDASTGDQGGGRKQRSAAGPLLGRSLRIVSLIATVIVAVLVGLAAVGIIPIPSGSSTPIPRWDFSGDFFIGRPIPLAWKYGGGTIDQSKSEQPILFELSSARDARFGSDARFETYADGDHKFVQHVNATRFWRVRAIESQAKRPLSDWSNSVQVTQYDSAYDRIKATGKALVYISNAEIQGAFKWVDKTGFRGFDISFANLIVDELSARMARHVEILLKPVLWRELLDTAGQGRADLVISSVTRLEERKRKFRIDFSDGYYCATQALIYPVDTPDGSLREMIRDKLVGAQERTTNAHLAEALATEDPFELKLFDTTETLIDALLRSEIDLGIVDGPFATTARIKTRLNGRDRLGFKEFKKADFPASISDEERVENYSIVVRSGEYELLNVINSVISKAKQDGSIARILSQAAREFEAANREPMGSRIADIQNDRPWECHL
jgi:ABC-type amino acid transport substrate-binding protein